MGSGPFHPQVQILEISQFSLRTWNIANLQAPYWRLYRNREIGGFVELDGTRHPIQPGTAMAIPPQTPCRAGLTGPVTHTFIHFTVNPPYAVMPSTIYSWPITDAIVALWDATEALIAERDLSDPELAMHALALITWAMAQLPPGDLSATSVDVRIERVLSAIAEDEDGALTGHDLARIAGMHPTAFARRFRQVTGTTPHAMAIARRIERAAVLLKQLGDIDEVAAATGFCDRAHFTRTFTKYRGMSPGVYRDLIQHP